MSWGRGIAIALTSFVIFIATLVTIILRQKVDLVSEDYYLNEIAYQDEIDAKLKGNQIEKYTIKLENDFYIVNFPVQKEMDSITVRFIRPNDERMDQFYKVKMDSPLIIPQEVLVKGRYQVECSYFQDGIRLSQYGELKVM